MTTKFVVPDAIQAGIVDKLERLAVRPNLPDSPTAAAIAASLEYVWACSAFAADACLRDAGLLEWLATEGRLLEHADVAWYAQTADAVTQPGSNDDATFMSALRIFRRRQLVRIAWRDLAEYAPIEQVLTELSWLADACIGVACRQAAALLGARHGRLTSP